MTRVTSNGTKIDVDRVDQYNLRSRKFVRFRNRTQEGIIRPCVGLFFQSDVARARRDWVPYDKPRIAEIDTGASVSCMGTTAMLVHGLREDKEAVGSIMKSVDRRKNIKARTKFVNVRVANTPVPTNQVMEVRYSRDFRDDLLLISWKWLRQYFDVFIDREYTYLLWDE